MQAKAIFKSLKNSFIPTLWRYFLTQYIKALAVSIFGILVILISTRLEDIARMVSLGASMQPIFLYIIYQIPYVLQVAIPISSLIAALYLFQRLSTNNELTAIRAAGISLYQLTAPLLFLSTLLALFFFSYAFDLSAKSHLAAKKLEFDLRSKYPLAVLQNSRILEQSGFSLDMKGSLKNDGEAKDMILALKSQDNGRCSLLLVKKVKANEEAIQGKNVTLISTMANPDVVGFDHLIIENSKESYLPLANIGHVLVKRPWKASNEMLTYTMLMAKKEELKKRLNALEYQDKGTRRVRKLIGRCDVELARRISLSLSIVTFAFLGITFGSHIGRQNPKRRIAYTIILSAFFLLCYLAAKASENKISAAMVLYFTPHVVLILASIVRLRKVQQGCEG